MVLKRDGLIIKPNADSKDKRKVAPDEVVEKIARQISEQYADDLNALAKAPDAGPFAQNVSKKQ